MRHISEHQWSEVLEKLFFELPPPKRSRDLQERDADKPAPVSAELKESWSLIPVTKSSVGESVFLFLVCFSVTEVNIVKKVMQCECAEVCIPL